MTDRNPGIIYENIQTPPLLIDGREACFDCCFICHVHDVRLDLRTSGREGDFSLFNGPLITVNQRNGSTCFDQKFCGCSSDSVAATCNNSHLAIEPKAVLPK